MASVNAHELIPSAKRLITSLRDMGYDFSSAVADLVDNSIEAKASRIDVRAEFFADDTWLRIVDNGRGMSPAQLREALRYGAEREYGATDLGRGARSAENPGYKYGNYIKNKHRGSEQ